MKSTLMNKRKWWRWPDGFYEDMNYIPWYQILRRLLSLPFLAVALVSLCLIVWFGWGRDDAKQLVRDIAK